MKTFFVISFLGTYALSLLGSSCITANRRQATQIEVVDNNVDSIPNKPIKRGRDTIPGNFLDFIKSELKQYNIPDSNDYINNWEQISGVKNIPYYLCDDFDGDGSNNYAFILESKNDSLLVLFVFTEQDSSYRYDLLDQLEYSIKGLDVVISIEPKGVWEAIDTSINVPNDGITVDLLDASLTWSYYWNGKKYVKFLYD